MNELTTGQAVQNLDHLIAGSRMTREEHIGMQQSLECLKRKAVEFDGQVGEDKAAKKKEIEEETNE